MATTIGKLNAILSLNSKKFEKGLGNSRKGLKKFGGAIDKADRRLKKFGEQGFGKLPTTALRAVAAFGALELAVKSVDAIGEAMNGEWEKSGELVKQLPAGIGPFAQALEGVLGKVTGITAEIAALDERVKAIDANTGRQKNIVGKLKEFEAYGDQLGREIALAKARSDVERQLIKNNYERLDALAKIDKLLKEGANAFADEQQLAVTVGRVNHLYGVRAIKIRDASRASHDMLETMRKDAAAVIDANRTPLEEFSREAGKLQSLLGAGLIDDGTFKRAMDQAKATLELSLSPESRRLEADMESFARGVIQSTMTPMERYEEQIGKLSEALEAGYLTFEQYGRGVRETRERLEESAKEVKRNPEARVGQFRQVHLNRIDVTGNVARMNRERGRVQSVKDPQLERTNTMLGKIESKIGGPAVAR